MDIGITNFSLLVTFYLDWEFILVRHRRASASGVIINQQLQTAGIKYWSKKFPLTNSTEVINTSRNNYIDTKLGRFPLNLYQQNQMDIAKSKFIEGYVKINENSFKSKELMTKQKNLLI
jgi:hypothetical protein